MAVLLASIYDEPVSSLRLIAASVLVGMMFYVVLAYRYTKAKIVSEPTARLLVGSLIASIVAGIILAVFITVAADDIMSSVTSVATIPAGIAAFVAFDAAETATHQYDRWPKVFYTGFGVFAVVLMTLFLLYAFT